MLPNEDFSPEKGITHRMLQDAVTKIGSDLAGEVPMKTMLLSTLCHIQTVGQQAHQTGVSSDAVIQRLGMLASCAITVMALGVDAISGKNGSLAYDDDDSPEDIARLEQLNDRVRRLVTALASEVE